MQAVSMLCTRGLLMKKGQLSLDDTVAEVVRTYLDTKTDQTAESFWERNSAPGNEMARLRSVRILDESGSVRYDHNIAKSISVEMDFWVLQQSHAIDASIHLVNNDGLTLFAVGASMNPAERKEPIEPGQYRAICRIPAHLLNDGKHYVSAYVVRNHADIVVAAQEAVSFMAHDYGTGRGGWTGKIIGAVRPRLPWDVARLGDLQ
jgi:lipopolysaccharide transport system ATP-binding protein